LDEIQDIAAVCYSLSLQLQNKDELAILALEEGLAANPGSERIRRQLTELYIRQCNREKAVEAADALPLTETQRDALRSAIRGACLASQNNWPAAKAYLQAAYQAGCRDPLCLRWYAITLLTIGDKPAARSVIDRWHEAHPTSAEAHRYLQRAASRSQELAPTGSPVRIDPQQGAPADMPVPNRAVISPATSHDLPGPAASV
jgi:lipopolysaccharide biosynthesis regulator YciM